MEETKDATEAKQEGKAKAKRALRNLNAVHRERLTFGQRVSDGLAKFAGSWTFIIIFAVILAGWIALNAWLLAAKAFDPYPFILLNLVLSTLAAIQAPVILMSQNRQEARDRLRADLDYEINVRAEDEIASVHAKLDALTEALKKGRP